MRTAIEKRERERMERHQRLLHRQLLQCIRKLPIEERAAFDQWYIKHHEKSDTSEWPGFKKYFPDGHFK